jgi:outer membrane protein TolC
MVALLIPMTAPAGPPPQQTPKPLEDRSLSAPPTVTVGLAQAVSIALERNFGLLTSVDQVKSARFAHGAARAEFYPKLTPRFFRASDESTVALDASQRLPWTGGTLEASATFKSLTPDDRPLSRSTDLRLVLTQPLLRGFGPNATYFELTNSRRTRQAQERAHELARQKLALEVTQAFYRVAQQRQLLEVARQSLERSRGLLQASEARLQVGLASKLDVFRAELQVAEAQASMVSFEAGLEAGLEQFRFLLGLGPSAAVEPELVVLDDEADESLEPVEALIARALERRIELHEARDEVDDARRSASLARQRLLPQLDVNLAVTRSGLGGSFSESLRAPDTRVDLSLTTSYPVERAADRANRAVAELTLEARERGRRLQELAIESDVRAAVRDLQRIRKSIELQRRGVDFAEQQHRLATLRYQRGLASNFDVVDAEGSLVRARTALVGLLTDRRVARIQLLRATGTLDLANEFGIEIEQEADR